MYYKLSGTLIANQIKQELTEEIKQLNLHPHLVIISVGEDEASKIYIKNKKKKCEEIGIKFTHTTFKENVFEREIIEKIAEYNDDPSVNGILVQLPLPEHLNKNKILNSIDPDKDVDGFHYLNMGNVFANGNKAILSPCTAQGVVELLKRYNIPIAGKNVLIRGRSITVGKPLAMMLLEEDAGVTIWHSKNQKTERMLNSFDIVISAAGTKEGRILDYDLYKNGTVFIDVGIMKQDDGKIIGDLDLAPLDQGNFSNKCFWITPVPGGVGPMTVIMLMKNVITACKNQNGMTESA